MIASASSIAESAIALVEQGGLSDVTEGFLARCQEFYVLVERMDKAGAVVYVRGCGLGLRVPVWSRD